SIGANCVVGGEIKNSVLFGNSNKAHDGYLGDSVLGEWCNLGAGTCNSNVKNTAGNVGYIMEKNAQPIYAGNKAGLLMGDYSRSAINTSFNTGSIVGVCCNIFGEIMQAKFTENFTWGKEKYIFDKALQDINNWMAFKNASLTETAKQKLQELYEKI
ncbi:MAG: glucose-1-phosphate thymidylyltransferase, partial [Ferruginibacter sp.]|nr:glucose-1-phosphate thymidylyltransferase [Ferruginibacter sp.]